MVDLPLNKILNVKELAISRKAASASLRAAGYAVVEATRGTPALQLNNSEQPELVRLDRVRVLVVDDEEMARELVVMILTQAGAETLTAASVAEALATLAALPPEQYPDVVISDLSMPDEDGYSLLRQLRQLAPERGGRLPAIALTSYGRMEDRVRVLGAGFQAHVTKPVEAEELVTVIASLVTRHSGHHYSGLQMNATVLE